MGNYIEASKECQKDKLLIKISSNQAFVGNFPSKCGQNDFEKAECLAEKFV
jgi:hypothetical protein